MGTPTPSDSRYVPPAVTAATTKRAVNGDATSALAAAQSRQPLPPTPQGSNSMLGQ